MPPPPAAGPGRRGSRAPAPAVAPAVAAAAAQRARVRPGLERGRGPGLYSGGGPSPAPARPLPASQPPEAAWSRGPPSLCLRAPLRRGLDGASCCLRGTWARGSPLLGAAGAVGPPLSPLSWDQEDQAGPMTQAFLGMTKLTQLPWPQCPATPCLPLPPSHVHLGLLCPEKGAPRSIEGPEGKPGPFAAPRRPPIALAWGPWQHSLSLLHLTPAGIKHQVWHRLWLLPVLLLGRPPPASSSPAKCSGGLLSGPRTPNPICPVQGWLCRLGGHRRRKGFPSRARGRTWRTGEPGGLTLAGGAGQVPRGRARRVPSCFKGGAQLCRLIWAPPPVATVAGSGCLGSSLRAGWREGGGWQGPRPGMCIQECGCTAHWGWDGDRPGAAGVPERLQVTRWGILPP